MQALSELSLTNEVWEDFEGLVDIAMHACILRVPSPVYSSQLSKANLLDLTSRAMDRIQLYRLRDCLTSIPNLRTLKLKVTVEYSSCNAQIVRRYLPLTELAQVISSFDDLSDLFLEGSRIIRLTGSLPSDFFGLMLKHSTQLRCLDLTDLFQFPDPENPYTPPGFVNECVNAVAAARHSSLLLRCLRIKCFKITSAASEEVDTLHEIAIGMGDVSTCRVKA
jgi:hypothetical protein